MIRMYEEMYFPGIKMKLQVYITTGIVIIASIFLAGCFNDRGACEGDTPLSKTVNYKYFAGKDAHGVSKSGMLQMEVFEPFIASSSKAWNENLTGPFECALDDPNWVFYGAEGRPRTAILLVHGGGWNVGSTFTFVFRNWWTMLSNSEIRVFSIEHRLSSCDFTPSMLSAPEKICWPHPSALEDVGDAVRYLKLNAELYNINPERIVIIGESSGAHLAMLHAVKSSEPSVKKLPCLHVNNGSPITGKVDCDASVAAVANFYGPIDFDMVRENISAGVFYTTISNYLGVDAGLLRRTLKKIDNNNELSEEENAVWEKYKDADVYHQIHGNIPSMFFSYSSSDQVVPRVTRERFLKKYEELSGSSIPVADLNGELLLENMLVEENAITLPHAYMLAMAMMGVEFYLNDYSAPGFDADKPDLDALLNPFTQLELIDNTLQEWIYYTTYGSNYFGG